MVRRKMPTPLAVAVRPMCTGGGLDLLVGSDDCVTSEVIPPTLHIGIEIRLCDCICVSIKEYEYDAQCHPSGGRGKRSDRTNLVERMCPQLMKSVSTQGRHSSLDRRRNFIPLCS